MHAKQSSMTHVDKTEFRIHDIMKPEHRIVKTFISTVIYPTQDLEEKRTKPYFQSVYDRFKSNNICKRIQV